MNRTHRILIAVIFLGMLVGCAKIVDAPKMIWGSSTKELEELRGQGATKDYSLSLDSCFNEVLKIAKIEEWNVFIQDKQKGLIVVMGIYGNVNTTEAGIFLSQRGEGKTEIEVVSLSPSAQESVSDILFSSMFKPPEEIKVPKLQSTP